MHTVTASLVTLTLWVCHPQPLPAQTDPTITDGAPVETVRRYRVSAQDSEIVILVFRAGALARFGHNHVISAHQLEGTVAVDTELGRSSFTLEIPVEALEVDNPDHRRQAGDDFTSEPSPADIAGTRDNMLGPRLLDATEYPLITVSGTAAGTTEGTAATVRFDVKRGSVERRVPLEALITDRSVSVTGTLELSHEELGLRPFRALGGALRVADLMEVRFEVNAVRDE